MTYWNSATNTRSTEPKKQKTRNLRDLYVILRAGKTKTDFDQEVKSTIVGIGLIGTQQKEKISLSMK